MSIVQATARRHDLKLNDNIYNELNCNMQHKRHSALSVVLLNAIFHKCCAMAYTATNDISTAVNYERNIFIIHSAQQVGAPGGIIGFQLSFNQFSCWSDVVAPRLLLWWPFNRSYKRNDISYCDICFNNISSENIWFWNICSDDISSRIIKFWNIC